MKDTVRGVRERAGRAARSLESALDDQVKRALGRLGLPTRGEIAELGRRVERLQRSLGESTAPRRGTKRSSAAAVKARRKRRDEGQGMK
jgi:hypothetical protein